MVTAQDVAFYAEFSHAGDIKALALEAMRDGDKALALRLLRAVSRDGTVDRDSLRTWAVAQEAEERAAFDRLCRETDELFAKYVVEEKPVMTVSTDPWNLADTCDLCGEPGDAEMGEFTDGDGEATLCHAQCGLDAGLTLA